MNKQNWGNMETLSVISPGGFSVGQCGSSFQIQEFCCDFLGKFGRSSPGLQRHFEPIQKSSSLSSKRTRATHPQGCWLGAQSNPSFKQDPEQPIPKEALSNSSSRGR